MRDKRRQLASLKSYQANKERKVSRVPWSPSKGCVLRLLGTELLVGSEQCAPMQMMSENTQIAAATEVKLATAMPQRQA